MVKITPSPPPRRVVGAAEVQFYCAWFCPFAQRAWIALEEKNVHYDYVECTLYRGDASTKVALTVAEKAALNPEFVAASPNGLVPAVRHGNAAVDDSHVVVEYVDGAFAGPPLLPSDPAEKARVRGAVAYFDDKVRPHFYAMLMAQDAPKQRAACDALRHNWGLLAERFAPASEGPYFLGARFSFFDVATLPWFQRLEPVLGTYRDFELPEAGRDAGWDRLRTWFDACVARPTVRRTLADREALVGNYVGYASGKATSKVARDIRRSGLLGLMHRGAGEHATNLRLSLLPVPVAAAAAFAAWLGVPARSSALGAAALLGFAVATALERGFFRALYTRRIASD